MVRVRVRAAVEQVRFACEDEAAIGLTLTLTLTQP